MNMTMLEELVANGSEIPVSIVETVLESIFAEYDSDAWEDADSQNRISIPMKIAEWFMDENCRFSGSDSEYHNLAVTLARRGMNVAACTVLESGMRTWGDSIDLLADYLEYGSKCKKETLGICEKYYNRLRSIPQEEWNWRAYAFSVDYLQAKRNAGLGDRAELKDVILTLSEDFCKKEKTDISFVTRAEVLNAFGRKEEAKAVLKKGAKLPQAHRCWLRLADLEFTAGKYDGAISYLEKCWKNPTPQDGVDKGYVFLLQALCCVTNFLKCRTDFNALTDDEVKDVEKIYKLFRSAENATNLKNSHKSVISSIRSILLTQTGVKDTSGSSSDSTDEFDF